MKKKKETPFLDFYNECVQAGKMPTNGLCAAFRHDYTVDLFEPTAADRNYYNIVSDYWGLDIAGRYITLDEKHSNLFTPLRQTIVLFCAAMNNEL